MDAKQFVKKLVEDNQALFQASQINVKAYFDSKPAQEVLVEHFVGHGQRAHEHGGNCQRSCCHAG